MTRIKRRRFLQCAGGAIATFGLNHLDLQHQSLRYGKVLAQSTSRKLALLVGINAYASPMTLYGCVTDVDLQRELLVHRFGFNPNDILTLTDGQATRQGMLAAYEEHLIKQAKPGDVVVFHYSGHGSQVVDVDRDHTDGLNGTLVPVDSTSGRENGQETINDIMGHTLFLMMSAIKTDQVTTVLDSCFSGGGTRGNLRVRAIPRLQRESGGIYPNRDELAYQQQWLNRLKLSKAEFQRQRRAGVAKGVVIASAKRDQFAADAPFDGFTAGAFTYYMTRYLWQEAGRTSVVHALTNIARQTTQDLDQDPKLECTPDCDGRNPDEQRPFYFLNSNVPPAESVVTHVSGQTFSCWLGGVDPKTVMAAGTILAIVDAQGQGVAKVQLNQRQGLVAKGVFLSGEQAALQPGALLQEEVRGIPKSLTLRIGLDPSLGDQLDRARAKLAQNPQITATALDAGPVDYILGKLTDAERRRFQDQGDQLPPDPAYGLFWPNKERILADTFAAERSGPIPDVETKIEALNPKFKLLLTSRILEAILNPSSAQLNIDAAIKPKGNPRASAITAMGTSRSQRRTRGGGPVFNSIVPAQGQVKPNDNIQISVENRESQDLYISVLAIDSTGEMTVIYPLDFSSAEDAALVGAGQTLLVPQPGRDQFEFVVSGPAGVIEILVIASVQPLRNTLKGLQKVATQRGLPVAVEEPLDAIANLLADTTETTRAFLKFKRNEGTQLMDVTRFAALSMSLEVVESK